MIESLLTVIISFLCGAGTYYFFIARKFLLENKILQKDLNDRQLRLMEVETRMMEKERVFSSREGDLSSFEERLVDKFQTLTLESLKKTTHELQTVTSQSMKELQGHNNEKLELREKNFSQLVQPLNDSLEKIRAQVEDVEKSRTGAYTGLLEQIKNLNSNQATLQKETATLSKALKSSTQVGQWGELQLRRVVESAGMLPYCDFEEQANLDGEKGKLRPDLIVKLPNGKSIIIDAKSPMSAFIAASETENEDEEKKFLSEHLLKIRSHIQALSSKSYWQALDESPDFVVMFLPTESMFSAALRLDSKLLDWAASKSVVIATPATLIALLKAIHFGWGERQLSEQAQEVAKLGREIYERLCDMTTNFSDIGQKLDSTVKSYNRSIGGLESRVLVSARKFEELNISHPQKSIGTLNSVDTTARDLQLPEVASRSSSESTTTL